MILLRVGCLPHQQCRRVWAMVACAAVGANCTHSHSFQQQYNTGKQFDRACTCRYAIPIFWRCHFIVVIVIVCVQRGVCVAIAWQCELNQPSELHHRTHIHIDIDTRIKRSQRRSILHLLLHPVPLLPSLALLCAGAARSCSPECASLVEGRFSTHHLSSSPDEANDDENERTATTTTRT